MTETPLTYAELLDLAGRVEDQGIRMAARATSPDSLLDTDEITVSANCFAIADALRRKMAAIPLAERMLHLDLPGASLSVGAEPAAFVRAEPDVLYVFGEGGKIVPAHRRPPPDLANLVRTMIAEHLGFRADEVADEVSLKHDLNADSLDLVELAMALEDTFDTGKCINDATIGEWRTPADIRRTVEGLYA